MNVARSCLHISGNQRLLVALTEELVGFALQIHSEVCEDLNRGEAISYYDSFYQELKNTVFPSLSHELFADMAAEALVYPLFAISFAGHEMGDFLMGKTTLPKSVTSIMNFLVGRSLLEENTFGYLPSVRSYLLFLQTKVFKGLEIPRKKHFVIHFYEEFLKQFNPKTKRRRGFFTTPDQIVEFMVLMVGDVLKKHFNVTEGLLGVFADQKKFSSLPKLDFNILDPAMGTGTFLVSIVELVLQQNSSNEPSNPINLALIRQIMSRISGFELMVAPYLVAQIELWYLLSRQIKLSETLNPDILLTNTLTDPSPKGKDLHDWLKAVSVEKSWLGTQMDRASYFKKTHPTSIIIGNPPYLGLSSNMKLWADSLVRGEVDGISYFDVDNQPLNERKTSWLYDDYVKFIRWGQWKLDQLGYGILAYVVNHGFLKNPTFRGMREKLLRSFDHFFILDLHGNINQGETTPSGSKDENLFDIQQGVAIIVLAKSPTPSGMTSRKVVHHSDVYGLREEKNMFLEKHNIDTIHWKEFTPTCPSYLFVPQDQSLLAEYERWPSVKDVFIVASPGIITSRDDFTIQFSSEQLWDVLTVFVGLGVEESRKIFNLGKDGRDWKVQAAQDDLKAAPLSKEAVSPILYRPFDIRFTYFTGRSRGFHSYPRGEVMKLMTQLDNVGLVTARTNKSSVMDHFLVTKFITEAKCGERTTQSFLFPLFRLNSDGVLVPNLSNAFLETICEKWGTTISLSESESPNTLSPLSLLGYMYAVFFSRSYRQRYRPFLSQDYPRLPLISNPNDLRTLISLGSELVRLHLMEEQNDGEHSVTLVGEGSSKVGSITKKSFREGVVWINKTQRLENIPKQIYTFTMGGYKVVERWLKARKDCELTEADLSYLGQLVGMILKTLDLVERIEIVVAGFGGWEALE